MSAYLTALAVIGETRSLATLDAFARDVWRQWGVKQLTDDEAQGLAEAIAARKREVRGIDIVAVRAPEAVARAKAAGRLSHFPPKRKAPRSLDRARSIQRRRRLAASGPMPPALASDFTTGELAVLRIVADEVRDRKACALTIGEIAARAGVCMTKARDAIRLAERLGLVTIEERRRSKRPNLPNIVRIISREWVAWIARGAAMRGGASKKAEPTDIHVSKSQSTRPARRKTGGKPEMTHAGAGKAQKEAIREGKRGYAAPPFGMR